ncbi:hypothetical protein RB600_001501 [Gaeumannomyces tritici]
MDEPKPTASPPSPSTRADPEAAHEAEPGSAVPPSLPPPPPPPRKVAQAKWALLAMAFFMADVSNAIGPFLGVFLQGHGWAPGLIGSVMTAGGVAALVASAPIGALIDATNHKRALAVGGTAVASAALVATLLGPRLPPLTFSAQVVGQVAGSLLMPSLVAMTLGVAGGGTDGFARLNGRNQAANHAGNMAGAGLSALLGQRYGLPAVFYLSWGFAAATVAAALCVPRGAVDHQAARGLGSEPAPPAPGDREAAAQDSSGNGGGGGEGRAEAWARLLRHRELVVLGLALAAYHLGNAAFLPLYGQAVVAERNADPAAFTGLTIVVAQGTMVVMALGASWAVARGLCGYWPVLLVSFCSLPVRAALGATFIEAWGVWPVQVLDGIGAGLQSIAVPGTVAQVLARTGRVNVGIGAVGTAQLVGSSLSPLLAGWIAQVRGYNVALYVLGIFPLISVALWVSTPILTRIKSRKLAGALR